MAQRTPALWTPGYVLGAFLNFLVATNYYMLMVAMTAYVLAVYGAPPSVAALCASIFALGALFSRFASPVLMKRFGRMPLLIAASAIEVAATLMYLAPIPLAVLIVTRVVHGFFYGVYNTCITTVVTALVPDERKGEGVGYFMLSMTLGGAVGPFLGMSLSNAYGFEFLFGVASLVIALVVPGSFVLDRWKRKAAPGGGPEASVSEEAAESAVGSALLGDSVEGEREEIAAVRLESAEAGDAPRAGQHQGRLRQVLGRLIEVRTLPVALVCGMVFFGYAGLLTFVGPYAADLGLERPAEFFFAVFSLSMFLTRPFTGKAFDRFGSHSVMVPGFLGFSCGMALLAGADSSWMLLGAAFLCGFGVGTVQAYGLAMVVRASSDERLPAVNATFYMMLDIGVGAGPFVLGLLVPHIGYSALYLVVALLGVAALLLFLAVARGKGAESKALAS